MLNEDYKDILRALYDENVSFLLVGAYAMAAHGYPRATMDIDIWVMPSPQNAEAVLCALRRFGAPLHDLTKEDLQKEGTIFQIGVAPRRIDIITAASGLRFEAAHKRALSVEIEGIKVYIPSIDDLITNKKASGRTKDLADVEALESLKSTSTDKKT
ncbi:nucleotidyltransferase [Myxococcota bacterium]|nr:nucleotidyltransferase [Myxococcota bacterium]